LQNYIHTNTGGFHVMSWGGGSSRLGGSSKGLSATKPSFGD